MKLISLTLLTLLAASGTAMADDWYLVGEVTHAKSKLDTGTTDSALAAAGATGLATSTVKDHSNQWRLQLGYKVNPNFAVEAGYIDFGKAEYRSDYAQGSASGTVKAGGVDIAALGIAPITDDFSVFGKVGIVAAHVKTSLAATGLATPPGDSTSNVVAPLLGLGVSYKLSDNVDLRAEYDHVSKLGKSGKTDKIGSDMVSAGLVYRF